VGEERWVGDSDDIFRGVGISIAGGVVAMVCVLSLRPFFLFVIMRYLFLGTKSLMQRKL